MLRHLAVLALVACEPPLHVQPLPELVAPRVARPMVVPALGFVAGESLIWNVHMQGLTIGRVELDVTDAHVHSRFTTTALANALAHVRHELVTDLDRRAARPVHSLDELDVDGDHTRVDAAFAGTRVAFGEHVVLVPAGNVGHTLHSALGVLRAWARPDAPPGYLYVLHAGELYKLEFAEPMREELQGQKTLRVECRVKVPDVAPIAISIWLAATSDHLPLRIEVHGGDIRLTAELISS
jgi:uncharacterized protein DUF3108